MIILSLLDKFSFLFFNINSLAIIAGDFKFTEMVLSNSNDHSIVSFSIGEDSAIPALLIIASGKPINLQVFLKLTRLSLSMLNMSFLMMINNEKYQL